MGIAINALSIICGTILGSIFKKVIKFTNLTVFAISIMIISMVGFFENIFDVTEVALKSNELLVVIFSLIIGSIIGDALKLDSRLNNISGSFNMGVSGIVDASVFFSIGGMQICGSIILATAGDSSQLIMKSVIDFPFALMYGMSYGVKAALAAIPVMAGQIAIVVITMLCCTFFDETLVRQLCSIGYIILFFSGFNLVVENKYKISSINMIVGIFIVLIFRLWG